MLLSPGTCAIRTYSSSSSKSKSADAFCGTRTGIKDRAPIEKFRASRRLTAADGGAGRLCLDETDAREQEAIVRASIAVFVFKPGIVKFVTISRGQQ